MDGRCFINEEEKCPSGVNAEDGMCNREWNDEVTIFDDPHICDGCTVKEVINYGGWGKDTKKTVVNCITPEIMKKELEGKRHEMPTFA
jgi:S-methylmethionine-dependent homocysteine/selenocysteine methylase